MKPKVLLIYMDQSAKLGILPYLSSIFHAYLDFDSNLIDQIDFQNLPSYQMILFSSALCMERIQETVRPYGIPMYQCRRALNYTYLHKILEIPSGSRVCIVNDRKKNCEAIMNTLTFLGFTQYRYEIYYPGGPEVSPAIQYAITPGESRFAPPSIPYIIDIGNRNVDIGTLGKIIMQFHLPEIILNQVTDHFASYIGIFTRYTNLQLYQANLISIENRKLLEQLDCGICVTDASGLIRQTNHAFQKLLCVGSSMLQGKHLTELLKPWDLNLDLERMISGERVRLKNFYGELVEFHFSKKFLSAGNEPVCLYLAYQAKSPEQSILSASVTDQSGSSLLAQMNSEIFRLLSKNGKLEKVLNLARAYAQSDFPVLILGDTGLYQLPIARYIHANSPRSKNKFLCLDAANPAAVISGLSGQDTAGALLSFRTFLEKLDGETLFIDHLDQASVGFQSFLCSLLKEQESSRLFFSGPHGGARIICSACTCLKERMLSGAFLPDLFYQVSTLTLKLLSVREMKEDLSFFLDYYMEELFPDSHGDMSNVFSEPLIAFLQEYDYPGNLQEMDNLFRYFSCVYEGRKLNLSQLPPHIQYRAPAQTDTLAPWHLEVLSILCQHPHYGRSRIAALLAERGIALTPHQLRTILAELSEKKYIQILTTKQGCQITELGRYIIENSNLSPSRRPVRSDI